MKSSVLLGSVLCLSASAWAFDFAKLKEQVKTEAATIAGACKNDKVKFCDKYKSLNEIKECLNQNKDQLSAGCKSALHL